jgi:hypothetical protein
MPPSVSSACLPLFSPFAWTTKTSLAGGPVSGVHYNTSGDCFAIGLAVEGWLLIFDDHTHTNMRYSLGDGQADGNAEYIFQQRECLQVRYLIPPETALDALRMWLETGELSDAVKWEDNPY